MDLSTVLATFLTLPNIFLVVIIFLITTVFRRVAEFLMKILAGKIDHGKIDQYVLYAWREVILPSCGFVFGGLFTWLFKYPVPSPFDSTMSSRVVFGIICGLLCTLLYPRFIYYFRLVGQIKKNRSQDDDSTDPTLLDTAQNKLEDLAKKK